MAATTMSHIRQILASTLPDDLKCRTVSEYLDSFERCPESDIEREVRNEEAHNEHVIEMRNLRGITAPDF